MIQSIITPWATQAVKSYFLLTEATRDPNWKKKALKAMDFMLTEMVHENGRVAYSLDRTAPAWIPYLPRNRRWPGFYWKLINELQSGVIWSKQSN